MDPPEFYMWSILLNNTKIIKSFNKKKTLGEILCDLMNNYECDFSKWVVQIGYAFGSVHYTGTHDLMAVLHFCILI